MNITKRWTQSSNKGIQKPNMKKIARFFILSVFYFVYGLLILWAAGALYYDSTLENPFIKTLPPILWLVMAGAAQMLLVRHHIKITAGTLLGILLIFLWHASINPRQDRDWQDVHSRTPSVTIKGNEYTINNIRDFHFRSPTNFSMSYVSRTFNIKKIQGIDVIMCHWGSVLMAHPILSFDFGDQGHICFSIETRREKNEGFSAIGGIYKMFELIYVASTERDCVMLRTNADGEEAFLYRSTLSPRDAEYLFLRYIQRINQLAASPEFYNAVSANCTTSIRKQNDQDTRLPWDWRILVNGKLDQMLYEKQLLDNSIPFDKLKHNAKINEKAMAAGYSDNFSEIIRHPDPAPR